MDIRAGVVMELAWAGKRGERRNAVQSKVRTVKARDLPGRFGRCGSGQMAGDRHLKAEHRMGHNGSSHSLGDAMNAIPAAGAATSRLLINWRITILWTFL